MAFQPHMLWFHKHVSYLSYALLTSGGLTAWLPPHISFFIAFPFLTTYFPLFPVQVWTFIHWSHLSSCSSLSQEKTINFIFAVLGLASGCRSPVDLTSARVDTVNGRHAQLERQEGRGEWYLPLQWQLAIESAHPILQDCISL